MAESFTFWKNMKETIDSYEGDPVYQYKMYDALTEYAFYNTWPEDDGTLEAKAIIAFVQSMVPSLEKSTDFAKRCSDSGSAGGRKQKVEDEQIFGAIKSATKKLNRVPTRQEVVDEIKSICGIEVSVKTITRRCDDEKKREIAEGTLGQIRDISNVPGTQGQNEDKINVSGDINNVPPAFDF